MEYKTIAPKENILTIGIPVYNGGDFIEETIKSIIFSKYNTAKVEILVSDNCSTDNTEEVVRKFPQIKYYKNETNLGYDRNIQNIFLKASGEYVWTVAADDVIINNGIDEIIALLESNLNIDLLNIAGNNTLQSDFYQFEGETFFLESKFQSGGVSSNIIKRDAWLISNPSDFFDTAWIHFGVILNLVNSCKSIVTRKQYVVENIRSANRKKAWDTNGSSLVVMLNLSLLFNKMMKFNYSSEIQKKAMFVVKGSYPNEIIKAKANGLKVDRKLLASFISCYYYFFSFWLIDLPILISPRWLCKFIYNQRNVFQIN